MVSCRSSDVAVAAIDASSPPRGGITPDARRETAINKGLAKRLEQLAIERERRERAALRDDAEFSTEFLNAARRCFEMIDKDDSGTLEKDEIVRAVRADQVANAASYDRAPFNLRGLRDLRRNCCFRVLGVWWCGIGRQ